VPGATVLVDGKEAGQSPLADEVFVDPGARTIEAKLAGYKEAKQTVEAAKGSSLEVTVVMVADVPRADGAPKPDASTGARGEGGPNKGTEIEPDKGGPHKGLIIAGIATSVVAIGAGIGFAVASNAHADDAEQQRAALIPKGASTCLTPTPVVEPGVGGGGSDGGTPVECVPSESTAIVADTCGVFVAVSGDDSNDGTKDSPVATLGKAVELAGAGSSKRVYACAETFEEALVLDGGIEMYGGLDCAKGWAYAGATSKTTLTAEADAIPLVLKSLAFGRCLELAKRCW
jgi:hypothetical protein